MSQPELPLSQFRPQPEVIRKQTAVLRSKFPCIDAHNHLGHWVLGNDKPDAVARLLETMDACNIRVMSNLMFPGRGTLDEVQAALKPRDRFYILAAIAWQDLLAQGDDFGERAAEFLEEQFLAGADGLKMYKSMGLTLRDKQGKLVHYDDDRLAPVFEVCARYNRPVLFHIADPTAFFKPLTQANERWEELQGRPAWHFFGDQYPSFMELMEVQDRFVGKYPDVKFQSAHVCSYAEDLAYVGQLLDRHPNLSCDISARLGEIGRVPRAAREFFIRYQDRVLFGLDGRPDGEQYRLYFRFLETDDEYFDYGTGPVPGQGRWCIYGVHLPDEVLRKIYFENAARLYVPPRG
jgi:predicted TIM-barrel fold metal-dependent hydrolase